MEKSTDFRRKMLPLAIAILIMLAPADGQSSNSLCTGPMLRSFNSCIGYLSGGSNGSSPTRACCNSLRDLMSNGQDCLCLIVTGGVPFQVPINRNLAISLPKACKQSGVPVECKATASPVPAPDPQNTPGAAGGPTQGAGGPSIYPGLSPPTSSRVPLIPQPFTPPSPRQGGGGGGQMTPETPDGDLVPTLTPPGMRPTLTPSAAHPSLSVLPSLVAATVIFFMC